MKKRLLLFLIVCALILNITGCKDSISQEEDNRNINKSQTVKENKVGFSWDEITADGVDEQL